MKVFEIGVYNSVIRDIIRSGRDIPKNNTISSEFENVLYFERVADSEAHARIRIGYEYPAKLGYVTEYVQKVRDNEQKR
tara:strand:+ start:569 stop:805 length:237 start_codon:yes stop_codon:yes gene_type:complete